MMSTISSATSATERAFSLNSSTVESEAFDPEATTAVSSCMEATAVLTPRTSFSWLSEASRMPSVRPETCLTFSMIPRSASSKPSVASLPCWALRAEVSISLAVSPAASEE
jgi:hypothetical protein